MLRLLWEWLLEAEHLPWNRQQVVMRMRWVLPFRSLMIFLIVNPIHRFWGSLLAAMQSRERLVLLLYWV